MSAHPIAAICRVLGVGRASAYRGPRPRGRYARRDDHQVAVQIRAIIGTRASYGYRRVTALVNRQFGTRYNRKRIRRVMALCGWTLPIRARRRNGRAHTGLIRRPRPDERWCSDTLEIACWNGEQVVVGFALDCHDREALSFVGAARDLVAADIQELMRLAVQRRFGEARPPRPVQWLSDNGSIYTALDTVVAAEQLGLEPITTPVCSPESNGMSEAFVWTMRRDYLDGADLSCAASVLEQLPHWIEDYNAIAPHSALGMKSPWQYQSEQVQRVVS